MEDEQEGEILGILDESSSSSSEDEVEEVPVVEGEGVAVEAPPPKLTKQEILAAARKARADRLASTLADLEHGTNARGRIAQWVRSQTYALSPHISRLHAHHMTGVFDFYVVRCHHAL